MNCKIIIPKIYFIDAYYIFIFIFVSIVLFFFQIIDLKSFLCILVIIIGFEPFLLLFLNKKRDSLSPEILLPFTYSFYALGPIMNSVIFQSHIVIKYLVIQILGLIALRCGLLSLFLRKKNIYYSPLQINKKNIQILIIIGIILLLFSIPSIGSQLIAFGGLKGLINVGYGGERYLILAREGAFGPGFEWLLLSSIIFLFSSLKKKSKIIFVIGIISFTITIIILLYIGSRSTLVYSIIFFVTLLHYTHKKFSNKIIVIGLLLCISLAQFYALARYFIPYGLMFAFKETFNIVLKNPQLILPWNTNEFKAPAASLLELIQFGEIDWLLGKSYISAMGSPIPFISRLFSEIGYNPSLWRLQQFHKDILASGGGLGFSPVTEGFMNFGILGVIIFMFIYGYVIKTIYIRMINSRNLNYLLLYSGCLPMFMLDGMRVHLASMLYKLFRGYLMPWLIFLIISLFLKNNKRK